MNNYSYVDRLISPEKLAECALTMTMTELARMVGVNDSTIRAALRRHGITPKPYVSKGMQALHALFGTEDQIKEAFQVHQIDEVSQRSGLARHALRRIEEKLGVRLLRTCSKCAQPKKYEEMSQRIGQACNKICLECERPTPPRPDTLPPERALWECVPMSSNVGINGFRCGRTYWEGMGMWMMGE